VKLASTLREKRSCKRELEVYGVALFEHIGRYWPSQECDE
jgi:hypothetical protein